MHLRDNIFCIIKYEKVWFQNAITVFKTVNKNTADQQNKNMIT